MGFDADKFLAEQWHPREMEIPVPSLAQWFGDGDKPIWKIRNLEGKELARARFAKERNIKLSANLDSIAELISVKDKEKLKAAFSKVLGDIDGEADTAWRTELLILGSVEPKVDYVLANNLFKHKATQYYEITNHILSLCGLGNEPGKQTPSGEIKKSKRQ